METRCENCWYWDAADQEGGLRPSTAACRRFPPRDTQWATTGPDDWCGEFRNLASGGTRSL